MPQVAKSNASKRTASRKSPLPRKFKRRILHTSCLPSQTVRKIQTATHLAQSVGVVDFNQQVVLDFAWASLNALLGNDAMEVNWRIYEIVHDKRNEKLIKRCGIKEIRAYAVSNKGQAAVIKIVPKIPFLHKKYLKYKVFDSNKRVGDSPEKTKHDNYRDVHSTVNETFGISGNKYQDFIRLRRNGKLVTRHLNGISTDNYSSNLAWGTIEDNVADKRTPKHTKPTRLAYKLHPAFPGLFVANDGDVSFHVYATPYSSSVGTVPRKGKQYSEMRIIKADGKDSWISVHRAVYTLFNGPITDGNFVLHNDGNRGNNSAINLRLGTAADNAADRDCHRRTPRGDSHSNTKYSESKKQELVRTAAEWAKAGNKFTARDLAKHFSMGIQSVYQTLTGKGKSMNELKANHASV